MFLKHEMLYKLYMKHRRSSTEEKKHQNRRKAGREERRLLISFEEEKRKRNMEKGEEKSVFIEGDVLTLSERREAHWPRERSLRAEREISLRREKKKWRREKETFKRNGWSISDLSLSFSKKYIIREYLSEIEREAHHVKREEVFLSTALYCHGILCRAHSVKEAESIKKILKLAQYSAGATFFSIESSAGHHSIWPSAQLFLLPYGLKATAGLEATASSYGWRSCLYKLLNAAKAYLNAAG